MSIDINAVLRDLDRRIQGRSLLSHPFYQAWTQGKLSLDVLRDYAAQYYRHVAAFPTYLSAVHSRMENAADRRWVLQNLMDEEAGSPNHPELWLMFCDGLGLQRQAVETTVPDEPTAMMVNAFRALCAADDPAEGLAALYAYESQIPAVAQSKIDGLKRFYGLDGNESIAYFKIHIEADKEHSAVERRLLGAYISEANVGRVTRAVDATLDALNGMLSGLCHKHGIAC